MTYPSVKIILICLLFTVKVNETKPLIELFKSLTEKQTEIKNQKLMQFISKSVPYGIDPSLSDGEAFQSDKSANFIHDGRGHVVFRQFRRLRLSDVLHRRGTSR
ncbi:hypothetical protein DICVIV_12407 [Dictyocaulus viviparus]|uniref:Uncharacterized protein n=1 Tax=Dictyocaulus viviparus TaxID=29172 RepID=A0A0D8XAK3_DICVI|nr:hypothetical protein DICVIV_12407 [Dictyocaulus viviparus]